MKINLIILATILAITAIATSFSAGWRPDVTQAQAPDFSYKSISGKKGSLYEHKGEIVLLHFWATWCAPCIIEFPDLIDLATKQKDNLVILAVSTDKNRKDIDKFLKKLKREIPTNFIVIQDKEKTISEGLYQTYKLPESLLISTGSSVIEKIIGPQENWNSDQWKQKIISLISE